MRSPFTQLYLHLVRATWDRAPLLTVPPRSEVYDLIQSECTRLKADALATGGIEDHVHLLVRVPATIAPAERVKQVKGSSAHALNNATGCIAHSAGRAATDSASPGAMSPSSSTTSCARRSTIRLAAPGPFSNLHREELFSIRWKVVGKMPRPESAKANFVLLLPRIHSPGSAGIGPRARSAGVRGVPLIRRAARFGHVRGPEVPGATGCGGRTKRHIGREMQIHRLTLALVAASMLAGALPASAQTAAADSSDRPSLFEARDLYYAGAFAAATVVMAPLDRAIARRLQDSTLQGSRFLKAASTGARLLGVPGSLVIGSSVYLGGRLTHSHDVSELGLHTTEAVIIADGITGVLKTVAGRGRPNLDPDSPDNFRFLGGLQGDPHRSFPSGHTTSAFAAASAASEEVGQLWPHQKGWVRVVLYGSAGLVGASRVYNNAHWASDVVVGAAIGSFTGWKVARYTHQHPHNTIDRIFLGRPPRDADEAAAQRQGFVRDEEGFPIVFTIHVP
jgi:membrane-associated phospholipid phosphatase/REP element-mobilizing transposase RayT